MPGNRCAHQRRVEVRQVEVDVGVLRPLHAADDRLGHDVARRQFGPRIVVGHEALAVLVAQVRPFAADRLADEVAARAGDVEHGRVELHELHVAQLGPGAVGGRHAVAGGDGRVGRLAVDHAAAAARRGSSAWPRSAALPRAAAGRPAPRRRRPRG